MPTLRDEWLDLQAEKAAIASAYLRGEAVDGRRYRELEIRQRRIVRDARRRGETWIECQ